MKRKPYFLLISVVVVFFLPIGYFVFTNFNNSLTQEAFGMSETHGISIESAKEISWMNVEEPYKLEEELTNGSRTEQKQQKGFLLIIEGDIVISAGYGDVSNKSEPGVVAVLVYEDKTSGSMATKTIDYEIVKKYGSLRTLSNPWATILWWIKDVIYFY